MLLSFWRRWGREAYRARALGVVLAGSLAMLAALAPQAGATTGAVSTTQDPNQTVEGVTTSVCLNGQGVNCNIYVQKQDVFLSGLPQSASVGTGTYFFAILDPGGQPNPNDGSAGNLSYPQSGPIDGDYHNRTFTVVPDGTIGYPDPAGTNFFDSTNSLLSVYPYADTSNHGGVYILAVCSLANGYPVKASDCKYDAFKVKASAITCQTDCGGQIVDDLQVIKDANPASQQNYTWGIHKSVVGSSLVKQIGGTATFNYSIAVTRNGPVPSLWTVTGTIQVLNPNNGDASEVDVTDAIDIQPNASCTVSPGTVDEAGATLGGVESTNGTVPGNSSVDYPYTCTYELEPVATSQTNTVTATWDATLLDTSTTPGASASYTLGFDWSTAAVTVYDACATITDSAPGGTPSSQTLGTPCGSATYSTSVTWPVPAANCVSYTNTGSFATFAGTSGSVNLATPLHDSSQATVTACGPANTGALTIGFWKQTNGQNLIKYYCVNGSYNLGAYLRGLGAGSGPFSIAPSTCSSLAEYVYKILNGASATNMNNMLKAQMLGTALDVWFSGPGWTSTTVSKTKPPSNFLKNNSLGTFSMDTTAICPMVDNSSTGTATCQNNTPSTNAVLAGALPTSPMTIQAILDYAGTVPPFNGSTSNSIWYGGNKTQGEILKNVFDQVNNQEAFAG